MPFHISKYIKIKRRYVGNHLGFATGPGSMFITQQMFHEQASLKPSSGWFFEPTHLKHMRARQIGFISSSPRFGVNIKKKMKKNTQSWQ